MVMPTIPGIANSVQAGGLAGAVTSLIFYGIAAAGIVIPSPFAPLVVLLVSGLVTHFVNDDVPSIAKQLSVTPEQLTALLKQVKLQSSYPGDQNGPAASKNF